MSENKHTQMYTCGIQTEGNGHRDNTRGASVRIHLRDWYFGYDEENVEAAGATYLSCKSNQGGRRGERKGSLRMLRKASSLL